MTASAQDLLEGAGFPRHGEPLPDPDSLTDAQRAVVEQLATADGHLPIFAWAIPLNAWAIRRWLGQEPAGALENPVTHDVDGSTVTEPLWRALERSGRDLPRVFRGLRLSIADRLDAYVDILLGAYRLPSHGLDWGRPEEVPATLGDWAAAAADRVLAAPHGTAPMGLRWGIFFALVRAGRAIEPRWDALLPAGTGTLRRPMLQCVAAIPEERRESALVAAVRRLSFGTDIVTCGLDMLAHHPFAALVGLVLAHAETAASAPKSSRISRRELDERLDRLGKRHRVVAEAVVALRTGEGPVPVLTVLHRSSPSDVTDLDPVRQAQVVHAGRLYDGQDEPAEVRLSPAPEDEDSSFAGSLRITILANAAGEAAFDVLEYRGDSGVVYEAGTTQVVAEIIQCGLQGGEPALRTALRAALLS